MNESRASLALGKEKRVEYGLVRHLVWVHREQILENLSSGKTLISTWKQISAEVKVRFSYRSFWYNVHKYITSHQNEENKTIEDNKLNKGKAEKKDSEKREEVGRSSRFSFSPKPDSEEII